MISAGSKLTIQRIPLACLQIREFQTRYPARLMHYVDLMRAHPNDDAGLIHVVPSDTHEGMYAILDGHHKFVASILVGRSDALCVIVEQAQ